VSAAGWPSPAQLCIRFGTPSTRTSSAPSLSVNVNAMIARGSTLSWRRPTTRREIASVLPAPAQATICRSPPRYEMVRACSGGELHCLAIDSRLSKFVETSGNQNASVTLHIRLAPEGWKARSTNPNSIDRRTIHAYDVSMKKIQILFPDPQMERLRRAARFEDRPISEIVRRATEDYLKKMALSPRPDAAATIPVFDGGDTLVGPERFRELAYSDRVGMHE
jgi:hypothetical protein